MYSLPAHVVPWYCLARHVMYSLYLHTYTITVMVRTVVVWVTTTDYVIPLWIMDPRSPYPVDVILLLVLTGDHQRTMVSVYLCTLIPSMLRTPSGIPCTGMECCVSYPYHEWWILVSSIWGTGYHPTPGLVDHHGDGVRGTWCMVWVVLIPLLAPMGCRAGVWCTPVYHYHHTTGYWYPVQWCGDGLYHYD